LPEIIACGQLNRGRGTFLTRKGSKPQKQAVESAYFPQLLNGPLGLVSFYNLEELDKEPLEVRGDWYVEGGTPACILPRLYKGLH
jgi:hypothetical protein